NSDRPASSLKHGTTTLRSVFPLILFPLEVSAIYPVRIDCSEHQRPGRESVVRLARFGSRHRLDRCGPGRSSATGSSQPFAAAFFFPANAMGGLAKLPSKCVKQADAEDNHNAGRHQLSWHTPAQGSIWRVSAAIRLYLLTCCGLGHLEAVPHCGTCRSQKSGVIAPFIADSVLIVRFSFKLVLLYGS